MSGPKQVLIVDQERFSALIAKMLPASYETDTVSDGMQAIKKLRSSKPELIVVEQDIPGNGIKLAELVGMSPKYSGIPIILVSANPSSDTIIRSRNAGVSAYLAKPFRPSELQSRIESAFRAAKAAAPDPAKADGGADGPGESAPGASGSPDEAEEEQQGEGAAIQQRVKQIEGLPPFPATHAEIIKQAKGDEASSEDLVGTIQMDPSFLATVLKLVNSSYYGFRKKVDSLSLAVTLLGMEEIANLVLSAQVFEQLGGYDEGGGLDPKEFWRHSVGTAFVARAIAKKLQTEVEAAFIAGMLHDVGKVVLDRFFADYYGTVLEIVQSEEKSLHDAEVEILGLSHAEVGGQLATEWKFSENVLNFILHHHYPKASRRHQRLVCVVHMANAITRELKFGSGGDDLVPDAEESVLERFHLGDRGLSVLREAGEADLGDAESFLSALAS